MAFGALVAALLAHVLFLWTIHEDAFIGFRYARNFAAGHGLRWNVDEAPVEGYTNFLWVALLAGADRLGLDLPRASQWLGLVAAIATLAVTARLARTLYRDAPGARLLPPLLLALSPSFAAWASSGMETSLFTLLVVLAVARDVRERDDPGRSPVSSVILALAAMTRPEGVLVFALVLAHRLVDPPRNRRDARALARWALGFVVPFGAYFAWRYAYYGFPLPNTFYAKVGSSPDQLVRGVKYVGKFFIVMGVPALGVAGFVLGRRSRIVSLAATIALPFLAYIAAVGGDYMAFFRFMVPVLPLLALATPMPIVALAARVRRPRAVWSGALVTLVAFSVLPSINVERVRADPPASGPWLRTHQPGHWYLKMRQHTGYARLLLERWHVNRFTLLGTWMQRELPREASAAYYGIGVIGYLCDRSILDMFGLNDAHIAHVTPATMGRGTAGHDKRDFLYVLRWEPTYLLYSRHFSPTPYGQDDLAGLYARELREMPPEQRTLALRRLERYAVENVWLVDEPNREAGYVTFLRLTRCSTEEGCRRCPRCERTALTD